MSAVEVLNRRIGYFIEQADAIEDECGDIFGAPIETFRRWRYFIRLASELMIVRNRMERTHA